MDSATQSLNNLFLSNGVNKKYKSLEHNIFIEKILLIKKKLFSTKY